MTNGPVSTNRFRLLVGAEDFLRAAREDIAAAKDSCLAQFMTYEGDDSGLAFSALLEAKAAAGLDVRLMVDCYTDVVLSDVYPILLHKLNSVDAERTRTREMFEEMRARGVPVRRTAPPGRFLRFMLYRDHKKMVVLDEHVAYVGGINLTAGGLTHRDAHTFVFKVIAEGIDAGFFGRTEIHFANRIVWDQIHFSVQP